MSYRVPAVGETWRSRGAPSYITAEILAGDDDLVTLRTTTTVGQSTKVSDRAVPLALFVHHYELAPESPNDSGAGVAAGAPLHLVGALPFAPPEPSIWGVPT